MAGRLVVGELRVQEIIRAGGRVSYTIVDTDCTLVGEADGFLRTCAAGTDRTYAYLLVDHLRWLRFAGLDTGSVSLEDLRHYMAAVGAEYRGPFGLPWRESKRPYGHSALKAAASCLKGFYLHLSIRGVNAALGERLRLSRLPTRADRRRAMLGHVLHTLPANPLAPDQRVRRHPKMLPEGAREALLGAVSCARDRMVVTWLADGGFRIGELCGLRLIDLHLREQAPCGQCRGAHVHICHREDNANRARAKTKAPWTLRDGTVCGGTVRRVSPAMIHTYFDYITSQYPAQPAHGHLLVSLHGSSLGRPWSTAAARGMLRRAAARLDIGHVTPHAFRHSFATAVLDAAHGNALIARDAGGWASAATVEQVYGHVDVHDPVFAAALEQVWGHRP
ncbi:tyrosine-type recombinase/integrase [Streptomyces sp. NPDC060085]|uniref:tyrosine-type recombinase/integrase n=1 Tax=Streptomyces sp. NPDC060085 TaxID=3347054 RepID=UPI00364CDBCC